MKRILKFGITLIIAALFAACNNPFLGGYAAGHGAESPELPSPESQTFSLTYNGNGNTGGIAPIDVTQYRSGALVTVYGNLGNLVKAGHTFAGWDTQADGNGTTYDNGETFVINADTALYAHWLMDAYGISLSAGGVDITSDIYHLPEAILGYGAQAEQTIMITNTENDATGALTVAVTGNESGKFVLSTDSIGSIPVGGTATFTIRPVQGLLRGIHSANITVTSAGVFAGFIVSFNVHINTEMVQIPAGSFIMGRTSGDGEARELPTRTVTLSAFKMGKYQVTQELYFAVTGTNPSSFSSNPATGEVQGRRPVERVNWYDALVFCNRLSMLEGLSPAYRIPGFGNSTNPSDWGEVPTESNAVWNAVEIAAGSTGYRLPTEAQWEYACRAGTQTVWYFGDEESNLAAYAWYTENSGSGTREVGLKPPNAFGLYDMHGNVWEWVWDWYASNYSSVMGQTNNPTGAVSGAYRVRRGGSWNSTAANTRTAYRINGTPSYRGSNYGFRLLLP